jgi:membrane-associated phospholipid phosphatase
MTSLLKKKRCRPGLLGIEKLGIIYAVATALTALLFRSEMPELPQMLATRAAFLAGIAVLAAVYRRRACHLTFFLRILLQMAMLAVWYPETYLFCRLFGNYDHVFAMVDQHIFGCQPALLFSEKLGGPVWCELFNLGYFSYYPMIAFLVIWTFMRRYLLFEKTTFIVMCSFFIFYAVFMFLPVAGPQFYYQAIGLDAARAGTFPQIELYFQNHFDMIDPPAGGALFQWLVEAAQKSGERPTAAFPSSHVGISSIIMILAWKADRHRRVFLGLLPFYTLLCFSTVYIHAHYAIDAIAGLLVAWPVYRISHAIYYTRTFHRPRGYHS